MSGGGLWAQEDVSALNRCLLSLQLITTKLLSASWFFLGEFVKILLLE